MNTTAKEAAKLAEELKGLMGNFDSESENRVKEISKWFGEHQDEETQKIYHEFMEDGLAEVGVEIADIRKQIKDEDYRLLPISHIAHKYFGKSHAWLSQRINGTPVRGHVYTLSAEQKQVFNHAMEDLAKFYGSFRLA
ncbi:MAG: DUF5053 domain-containing protein [Prevotella sp.]|nr:DUF5053 domain-containing protein [Prevotella sp.]